MKVIRAFLKPLSFLPALCIMYMIFTFSAQEGAVSSQLSYKVSYKIVETGGKLLGEDLQPWEIDSLATRFHGIVRKLAHMTEYFALAVSVAFPLYVYGLRGIWLMLVAGFICVAFACGDEYHQSFVAGRAPSKRDVLIDSFGVLLGILLVRIVGWTGRKTIFRPFTDEHIAYKKQKKQERAARKQAKKAAAGGNPTSSYYNANPQYQNGPQPSVYPPNGMPYQNTPYPNETYQNMPYQNAPYQNGAYQNGAYQDMPYQNAPYQNGDYQNAPYQNAPYQNVPYQDAPYQNAGYSERPNNGYYRPPMPDEDHHISDKLSEDMSFKKLMQELREQKQETKRDARRTDYKKPVNPEGIEVDEIDLND